MQRASGGEVQVEDVGRWCRWEVQAGGLKHVARTCKGALAPSSANCPSPNPFH